MRVEGFLWPAAHPLPKRSPVTPAFLPRCFTFLWGCHRDVRLPRVLRTLRRMQRATHTSRWPAAHQCRADTSTVFGARPWIMWRQCHCVPASEATCLCCRDLGHATPELHDTCTCLPWERTCTRQTQAQKKQRGPSTAIPAEILQQTTMTKGTPENCMTNLLRMCPP